MGPPHERGGESHGSKRLHEVRQLQWGRRMNAAESSAAASAPNGASASFNGAAA
ncbi:MAG: hypothetical protein RL685_3631 [Pseudomonadota bacterium]